MPDEPVLAIDIGGTKVAVGIVDLATHTALSTRMAPTPATHGGLAVYQTVIDLCKQLPEITTIQAIGVCFGGLVNRNRVMHSNHVDGWANFSLEERLKQDIAPVPVRIINDANAIAWLEWTRHSKADNLQSLFYLTVSTGIGGGLVIDNKIIEGRNGMASEIGHLILEADGPVCSCGNHGCLEALAAGPAISKAYLALSGKDITASEISTLATYGDITAIEVLRQSGQYVGRALAALNVILDVDQIIIGGGVSRAGSIWWDALEAQLAAHTLPWSKPPSLSISSYGKLEGIFAGAVLFYDSV
ncbi:MAG: ROK family protein [Aggregatilineales bacterium]